MDERGQTIIRELLKKENTTANELAAILSVTDRSIKNYIRRINDEVPGLILSSRRGYLVSKEVLQQQNFLSEDVPGNSKERIKYIIDLLVSNDESFSLNMDDLCDELYVSITTMRSDLKKVKAKLMKYDLDLQIAGSEISLVGKESDRRNYLSSLLQEESKNTINESMNIFETFSEIDVSKIKQLIVAVLDENRYFINDYSMQSLLIHTTIAIDRMMNGYHMSADNALKDTSLPEYSIAEEIFSKISNLYDISYTKQDVYDLALLIASRATSVNYHEVDISNVREFIGEECYTLVSHVITEINDLYSIDLSDNEFFVRFALHIKNLLFRTQNDYMIKNPLTRNIKGSFPLIFDMSVVIAGIINENTGSKISDDEIAYICFHLGSAIELKNRYESKINAVLLSQDYYDMNYRLLKQLNEAFSNDLIITDVINTETILNRDEKIDLILTTSPLSYQYYSIAEIVAINVFLTDRDKTAIREVIERIRKNKKITKFKQDLLKITNEELFELNSSLENKEECIEYICKKLTEFNYIEASFIDEIYERENLSSTSYGYFAIPHSIYFSAKKTGIYILISDRGIAWNDDTVKIVLLMCFSSGERRIFNDIFGPIASILSDPASAEKLGQCNTYSEFIDLLSFMFAE